jgi:hypothetical protein
MKNSNWKLIIGDEYKPDYKFPIAILSLPLRLTFTLFPDLDRCSNR